METILNQINWHGTVKTEEYNVGKILLIFDYLQH